MRKISLADTIRVRLDDVELMLNAYYDVLEAQRAANDTRDMRHTQYQCQVLEEEREELLEMLYRELELDEMAEGV